MQFLFQRGGTHGGRPSYDVTTPRRQQCHSEPEPERELWRPPARARLRVQVQFSGQVHERPSPDGRVVKPSQKRDNVVAFPHIVSDVSMGHVASGVWSSSDGDEGDYAGIQRERCRDLQILPELANVFCAVSSVDLVNVHDAPSLLVTIGVGSNSAIMLLEHSDQGWCIQTVVHPSSGAFR